MLALFLLSACLSLSSPLSLQFSHSCDGVTWEPRGVLSVKNEKSSSGNFTQQSVPSRFLSCLWSRAESDGFYYLRAPASFSPHGDSTQAPSSTQYVQSFTKCRHLFCSDLSDLITVYTDSKGSIMSIFSESKRSCVSSEDWSRGVKSQGRDRFSSSLSLLHSHQFPGPEPPVQAFLDGERKKEVGKEKEGEEKSFFQKYWQYLLIGFIVYILMTVLGKGGEEGGTE